MPKNIKIGSPEFKAMEQEWYQKLKEDGFEDIEDTSRKDMPLKTWHSIKFKLKDSKTRMHKQTYYEDAKELLLTYKFKNETHKTIWSLHCEGLSSRDIEVKLAVLAELKRIKYRAIAYFINEIAKTIKKEDKKCQR